MWQIQRTVARSSRNSRYPEEFLELQPFPKNDRLWVSHRMQNIWSGQKQEKRNGSVQNEAAEKCLDRAANRFLGCFQLRESRRS